MGEVYLAEDSRLDRKVALKVLPSDEDLDAARLQRFEREAKILAQLDHPNIAAVYSFEEVEGRRLIAMQLVEGETLAARLSHPSGRGLPRQTALEIALQIAEGLEAAHERGIIHRDLKPANVMVDSDDRVRLLDFGLGKIWGPPAADQDASQAATIADDRTRTGVVLGTAAYMSPEQARGQEVDRRTDIWAFGCVLFEMFAGQRAFPGETASARLAAVLGAEPPWHALPKDLPARVRRLLERCLSKDPRQRLRDIGDVRLEIEDLLHRSSNEPRAEPAAMSAGWSQHLAVSLSAVASAAAGALVVWLLMAPTESPGFRGLALSLAHPLELSDVESQLSGMFAISPDGSKLAYMGREGGASLLYVMALDSGTTSRVPATGGARAPFFSPDNRWLGYVQGTDVEIAPLEGGSPVVVGSTFRRSRPTWEADGGIVFSNPDGVFRVRTRGEKPVRLCAAAEERILLDPAWLPEGKGVLLTSRGALLDEPSRVELLTVETGERRVLVENGGSPAYVPSTGFGGRGSLLYALDGRIYAAPFDLETLEVTGPAIGVVGNVLMRPNGDAAQYAFSDNGLLVYASDEGLAELVRVDEVGRVEVLSAEQRPFAMPRLSPDGSRLAVEVHEVPHQIWLLDIAKDLLSRFTLDGSNHNFTWYRDGRSILYTSDSGGGVRLLWKRVDSQGEPVEVYSGSPEGWVVSVSADGRLAAFHSFSDAPGTSTAEHEIEGQSYDVFLLPLDGGMPPRPTGPVIPIATSRRNERDPWVSPDGACVAYVVREAGSAEVHVTCWQAGTTHQISVGGGSEPVWARSGEAIYYRSENRVMRVDVEREPEFRAGPPRVVFEGNFRPFEPANFDVTGDGRGFVQLRSASRGGSASHLPVRLDWFRELESLQRSR